MKVKVKPGRRSQAVERFDHPTTPGIVLRVRTICDFRDERRTKPRMRWEVYCRAHCIPVGTSQWSFESAWNEGLPTISRWLQEGNHPELFGYW
jgi:hypothetical protein